MLVVEARIRTKPGKRDEFIREAQTVIAATRKEEGCIHYELFAATEDADRLMYFEKWSGREALAKHQASEHLKAFAKVREEKGLVEGPSEVNVFEVNG